MRTSLQSIGTLLFAVALTGCASNHADIEAIGHYGGYSTPAFDGYLAECPPLAAIDFSTRRQIITDDDLANMLPSLKRLNPRRICLGGQPITDRSIEVLNQLPFLQSLSLEGTQVTPQGRGRLRLAHWE
ncbi:MAG: hypothetical protein JWN40_3099 [Phycisphaerales bacterium]|jgi:hypothetical protein|nr:hypothetical protein [Phycisphaerales bacterium]